MSGHSGRFKKVDAKRNSGKGRPLASSPSYSSAPSVPAPKLADGQVRCPVCRNATKRTPTGRLRMHNDLFGLRCYNRNPGDLAHVDAPPVVLPPERGDRPSERPKAAEPAERRASRLDAGSLCQECGKWLPGERRMCGKCFVRFGRP